ncbi:glycosyltransferase family 1 protein (plasmid) [Deinococcus metallilatus]|uniref:Glycosyltransferase n=1 Tax=Deinococcus metallilatus TaxID=1211322 RepID=A0AAJ5F5N7_9DEIO|nr:glycosyltransferase [Deinococcus metallilatus]MBB5293317.1 glycosyltransferase involved in cell wall biosynthesis [Deinococcus metallilatus]QBY06424.1 glycosyltransferase family 1 protein [Deinococcus metallilatus]RXJ18103.1 glycosyltransferase family 1 protein [Deinococcus metallilatus]TLK32039.1 glycosyltransferase [Deinococcus metallilatus]GMA15460.1 hypothetical protein GCM10025871_17910 [Deinococcus metallilatus]
MKLPGDRLTVCLLTSSAEPSGMGEHMLTLARELEERYRVVLVAPPVQGGRALLDRAAALGLEVLPLDARGERPDWLPLRDWLRRHRVAVFHGHAGVGWEGHSALWAAREAGVPAILRTEHLPDVITLPRERESHRRAVAAVDRLICVSEAARQSFLAAGFPADKLRVVHNGIAPHLGAADRPGVRARLGLPPDAQLVLTVARFSKQKGHRFLLEAVPAVLGRCPRAHFVWAGTGPLLGRLRARVARLGLARRVHLVGQRDDIPDLMAAADVFVLPSLFEGLPLAVLEAMAAGLPVIGTDVCGTGEAVQDGFSGWLVPPADPAALARALLEALTRPDLAAQRAAAGRARFGHEFSAGRMAAETARLYEEVLAERPRREPLPASLPLPERPPERGAWAGERHAQPEPAE